MSSGTLNWCRFPTSNGEQTNTSVSSRRYHRSGRVASLWDCLLQLRSGWNSTYSFLQLGVITSICEVYEGICEVVFQSPFCAIMLLSFIISFHILFHSWLSILFPNPNSPPTWSHVVRLVRQNDTPYPIVPYIDGLWDNLGARQFSVVLCFIKNTQLYSDDIWSWNQLQYCSLPISRSLMNCQFVV